MVGIYFDDRSIDCILLPSVLFRQTPNSGLTLPISPLALKRSPNRTCGITISRGPQLGGITKQN
ncbi:hypothetical protein J6590_004354 [Homalodisca vitripennis]|nr:hypothetical protein J6590_004354 [Homalodisca vitripennis]